MSQLPAILEVYWNISNILASSIGFIIGSIDSPNRFSVYISCSFNWIAAIFNTLHTPSGKKLIKTVAVHIKQGLCVHVPYDTLPRDSLHSQQHSAYKLINHQTIRSINFSSGLVGIYVKNPIWSETLRRVTFNKHHFLHLQFLQHIFQLFVKITLEFAYFEFSLQTFLFFASHNFQPST